MYNVVLVSGTQQSILVRYTYMCVCVYIYIFIHFFKFFP